MPEAGRTPEADFKRGDNNLAYGEASAANSLMGLVATGPGPDEFVPSGEEEEFVYSQTDRPEEPVTAGVPFGPGAVGTPHAVQSDAELAQQVARRIAADPGAPKSLKAFARRAIEGQ